MLRLLRAGAMAVVLLCLADGVAAADPLPVADVTQSADTDDGWHLSAAITRMTINSVPNMAATAFTREGFVTGKAAATIDGNGAVAVNAGTLVLGLQLGCQVDLSEGGSVGVDADAGISPGFNNGANLLNIVGRTPISAETRRSTCCPEPSRIWGWARRSSRAAPVRSSSTMRTSR